MALTFFWRCETETLDGTHDYSAGDTTASGNASVALSGTAAKVGSNGILVNAASKRYSFDPASIITPAGGCFGHWFNIQSSLTTGGQCFYCRGTNSNDHVALETVSNGQRVLLKLRHSTNGAVTLSTSSGTVTSEMSTGSWYFIVGRWDIASDYRRIEVYDSTLTLIQHHTDTGTDLSSYQPVDFIAGGLRFGDATGWGGSTTAYIDNIFIASNYDEAIESKANITSYTEYAGSTVAPKASFYRMLRNL